VDNGYPREWRLDEAEVRLQAHLPPIEAHISPRLARGTEARRGTIHTLHTLPRPSAGSFQNYRCKADLCRSAGTQSSATLASSGRGLKWRRAQVLPLFGVLHRLFRCWSISTSRSRRTSIPTIVPTSLPLLLERSPQTVDHHACECSSPQ
jgi:hypothetical protein